MLSADEIFDVWAPRESVWAAWAKPVLFSEMTDEPARTSPRFNETDEGETDEVTEFVSPIPRSAAVIVDLSGPRAVEVGLAMARRGLSPVPLFNAAYEPFALVNLMPTWKAIVYATDDLRKLRSRGAIAPDAPPAFLLDAGRCPFVVDERREGVFDNRWIVFPQDFPSGRYMLQHGIDTVVLVQRGKRPQQDLLHVVLRWREAGMTILVNDVNTTQGLQPLARDYVPTWFKSSLYRALALLGLRRNSAGGFGATIPIQSSGG
jgi:hypothetical protein